MSREIGGRAEGTALKYLEQQGFTLIIQNFFTPLGEIDLIGLMDETLLFIEVKIRKSAGFGGALEMVTYTKQNKIRKTAEVFLQRYQQYQSYECRFDVIGITAGQLEWIKGAF